uniref:Uncharacterized protein n=1 Tax=Triticum urartu TaxID=4572 RepID=A0A8R7QYB2_TRIUA
MLCSDTVSRRSCRWCGRPPRNGMHTFAPESAWNGLVMQIDRAAARLCSGAQLGRRPEPTTRAAFLFLAAPQSCARDRPAHIRTGQLGIRHERRAANPSAPTGRIWLHRMLYRRARGLARGGERRGRSTPWREEEGPDDVEGRGGAMERSG